jgi:hypothetical protein
MSSREVSEVSLNTVRTDIRVRPIWVLLKGRVVIVSWDVTCAAWYSFSCHVPPTPVFQSSIIITLWIDPSSYILPVAPQLKSVVWQSSEYLVHRYEYIYTTPAPITTTRHFFVVSAFTIGAKLTSL